MGRSVGLFEVDTFSERMYDAFWTQTPLNMAKFSDTPLPSLKPEELYYDFFPARYVTSYLEEYVDKHIYGGLSLRERIAFNTTVSSVQRDPVSGQWALSIGERPTLFTSKLIVCSGLTSIPKMPSLPGQESYKGEIMHHKDFGSSSILSDPEVKHIAVIGGAKSAADLAYAAAKAGKTVSWIIRKSGSGPAALVPAKGIGPYKNSNEVLYTRLTATLNPSIWTPQTWLARLLHRSGIGRRIVDWIWDVQDGAVRREAGFEPGLSENRTGYQNLQPDTPLFWGNDSNGVNQRPDFWTTMASDNVQVFREDIIKVNGDKIIMPGATVSPDVILCGTGWQPSYHKFFDDELARSLGLPTPTRTSENNPTDAKANGAWTDMQKLKDVEIVRCFPQLQHPPSHHTSEATSTPFRLYKHMIPLKSEMSGIVFLGHIVVGNNFRAAECQALWAVSYLDGHPILPSPEFMSEEVAMNLAWCRRRYLEKGKLGHWLYYDLVPYTDALLEEIGLTSHKRKGRLKNFFTPCVAEDLKGLVGELKEKYYSYQDPSI